MGDNGSPYGPSIAPGSPGAWNADAAADNARTNKQQDEFEAKKAADDKAAADAAAAAAAKAAADAHFQYGGYANGANDAAARYRQQGEEAQKRQAGAINYTQADLDRGQNQDARLGQRSAADMLLGRANGSVPLIANQRAALDTSHALADQSSIAASARGPAALALAQQNQANNSAAAISNISNQAQINGSQEQLNDTLAASQAYGAMRGGDQSAAVSDAQKAQYQSQLDEQQRAENDRYQLGMTGAETDVQKAQLQAQGNQVGIATGATTAANALNQQASQFNRSNAAQYIAPIIGAGATVAGGLLLGALGGSGGKSGADGGVAGGGTSIGTSAGAGVGAGSGGTAGDGAYNAGSAISDGSSGDSSGDPWPPGRADGGPVRAGQPYLVGERGPELIVPPRDGHVLTAEQTRAVAPSNRADALLENIHPLSYTYKDPAAEPRSRPTGGRYLGISAQDLEATPEIGHQLVSEGPHGKQIEMGPTLSAALAGMARLHERVKAVEGQGHALTSDMAAKTEVNTEGATPYVDPRAKAWDEGHNAALEKVQQYRQMTPEQLKELGARGNRLANAVAGAKADAWDEARGKPPLQHLMSGTPSWVREPTSFTRGDDADTSQQHPLAMRVPPASMASAAEGATQGAESHPLAYTTGGRR